MIGEGKPMDQYEEISLKDLILIILKGWKWIVGSTLLIVGIAVVVFMVGNITTYSLSSQATLHYSQNYVTEYGSFESNLLKAEDVLLLIQDDFYEELQTMTAHEFAVEDLTPYITFKVTAPNSIVIDYTGLSKVDLENLQSNVANRLSLFLSEKLQKKAQEFFIKFNTEEMMSAAFRIKNNEELIILFEAELSKTSLALANGLINPVYSSLAEKVQALKNENIVLNYTLSLKQKKIENLNTLEVEESLPFVAIYADIENTTQVIETQQFSAKTLFPISLVLGVMVGVFVVLFLNYWKTAK